MKNVPTLDKKVTEKPGTVLHRQNQSPIRTNLNMEITDGANKKENRKDSSSKDKSTKTVETMLRITSGNSQKLSNQADAKSHILISVNTIIVSVMVALLSKQFKEGSLFSIPLIIQLTVSMVTIGFAILATRPTVSTGVFTQNDLREKNVNLLFFGNFYKMKFDEYAAGMFQVMKDDQLLYLSLLSDLYCQGVVLGKKYKMLKAAYYVFMFGLIVSVIAFLIIARFNNQHLSIIAYAN
jgi:hypothetical protein